MPGSESRMAASGGSGDGAGRGLGGRVRVFRRCGLGELVHQSVELAARVTELPVDQHEAFGEEPHMRGGGLGGARRDLDDRRPQPLTQRRGIDPADAVLLQQFGERRLANALRPRRWSRRAAAGSSARAARASGWPGACVPASALR